MRRTTTWILALALLLPVLAWAGGRLAPVRVFAARLDASMNGALEGKAGAEAFDPWRVDPAIDDELAALRKEMLGAGGARLELVGFEFELVFADGAGRVVEAEVVVIPGADKVGLLEFDVDERSGASGVPIASPPAGAESIAGTARALARELQSERCAEIWIPDPTVRWPDAPFLAEAKAELDELRAALPERCGLLGGDLALTHFDVDDFGFFVWAADGSLVGLIDGDLEIDEAAVAVDLGGFEKPPEPPEPPEPAEPAEPQQPAPRESEGGAAPD